MRHRHHILTFISILCILCACGKKDVQPSDSVTGDTLPTLIMQVQKCSRLYTTEYRIHKIVTHDDVLRLKGNILQQDVDIALPFGERKIAIPLDATLKAYIDFSEFSEKNIEREGNRITLLLPDPKIVMTSSKINRQQIHEYVGLTRSHFTDKELTFYEQQGRMAILNSIRELGIIKMAQENATQVLVPMLVEMGYDEKNITIAFRKSLDIEQIINANLERK